MCRTLLEWKSANSKQNEDLKLGCIVWKMFCRYPFDFNTNHGRLLIRIQAAGVAENAPHALVEAIKSATRFDEESQPECLVKSERDLSCMSSTSDDIKTRLRRLTSPKILNDFDALKSSVQLSSTQLSTVAASPIKVNDEEILSSFFQGLESNNPTGMYGCIHMWHYSSVPIVSFFRHHRRTL